ncbi:MAG: hypothetical protein ABIF11_08760 [Nitrospirota bacterium]
MKAIYWNNELHAWNLSDSLAETFRNLGFEIREMSSREIDRELLVIQKKALDDLYGDSETFDSIE